MNDFDLLREYADRGSDDAFTALVRRYVDLVYSAALRQTCDPHHAEETTQAVFIVLARKARALRPDTILSGWLLRTARFVALNARRREMHRIKTEHEAMNLYPADTDTTWKRIAPILDEALVKLSESDRAAVALRFFEEKSFKEVGLSLGTSEDVAQKRVSRAVEKLRADFARRGLVLPAAAIAGALAANAVQAAPGMLAAAVGAAAVPGAAGPAVLLAKATFSAVLAARLKLRLLQAAAVGVVAVAVWLTAQSRKDQPAATIPAPVPQAAADVVVATTTPAAPTVVSAVAPETNLNTLRFQVVDATSQAPIPQVRLSLTWAAGLPNRMTNDAITDQAGSATFALALTTVPDWDYRIEVYRDGYVPKYVSWSALQGDNFNDIPLLYTTKLERGVTIGGVVQNDAGAPVAGARVVFDVTSKLQTVERERLTMGAHYHVEMTDSMGRWQCSHVPDQVPDQFGYINFRVFHPDYASAQFGSATLGATNNYGGAHLATADLRQGIAVMKVHAGGVAGGVVVDEAGNPVAGARVTFDRTFWEPTANQITGSDGRFQFMNMDLKTEQPSGNSICFLTAQAEGFAPMDLRISGAVPPAESRLTLARGAPLRGRVVDEQGRAIPNASVQICSHSNVRRFEWRTMTDASGKFEWLNAPPGPESYTVDAAGYEPIPELKWTPDGTEQGVTLHAVVPVRFSGSVVDAATGQPLDKFEIWMSASENAQTGYSQPAARIRPSQFRAAGEAGAFSFTNRSPLLSCTLEIRAEGYAAETKSLRGPVASETRCDFKMQHAWPVNGVVQLPDGTPTEGALVIFCTEFTIGYMRLPGQFDLGLSGASHVETDAQGRFSFSPKANAKSILVTTPKNFAAVKIGENGEPMIVTLAPWGRVAGKLRIGSRPGTNQTIYLHLPGVPIGSPGYVVHLEATTDADGQFVFEGVPPGPMEISHRLTTLVEDQQMEILVQAGQTTEVTLGGTGRKVVGRLKVADPERKVNWQHDVQYLTTKMVGIPAPSPQQNFASEEEFDKAWHDQVERLRTYYTSEDGQQARRNRRGYVLEFEQDGSFKIEDVMPGTYELRIRVSDTGAPVATTGVAGTRGMYKPLSELVKEVTVPESPAGDAPEPFDLGVIELQ